MVTRTPGSENSKHAHVSSSSRFHARYARRTKRKRDFYNVDGDCRCTPKWDSLRRCFLLQIKTGGDVSSLIFKDPKNLTCIDFYDPWELRIAIQKSVNLLRVYSLFFHDTFNSKHPTPTLWYPANTAAPHSIPLPRAKREESRRLSSRFASCSGSKWEAAVFAGWRYNFWKTNITGA